MILLVQKQHVLLQCCDRVQWCRCNYLQIYIQWYGVYLFSPYFLAGLYLQGKIYNCNFQIFEQNEVERQSLVHQYSTNIPAAVVCSSVAVKKPHQSRIVRKTEQLGLIKNRLKIFKNRPEILSNLCGFDHTLKTLSQKHSLVM